MKNPSGFPVVDQSVANLRSGYAGSTKPPISTQHPKPEPIINMHSQVQASLAHFDSLPDSAYVRLPVALGLFACSKSTFWHWVKISRVPSPKKIGARISAWNVGQLRQTLRQLDASNQTSTMTP